MLIIQGDSEECAEPHIYINHAVLSKSNTINSQKIEGVMAGWNYGDTYFESNVFKCNDAVSVIHTAWW
jgi:hypothetical protein